VSLKRRILEYLQWPLPADAAEDEAIARLAAAEPARGVQLHRPIEIDGVTYTPQSDGELEQVRSMLVIRGDS